MIETRYRAPLHPEIKSEGYWRQYVSYEATDEIISYLTTYGNPFQQIAQDYIDTHQGSIVHPTRLAVSLMAYGMANVEQFGGVYDNVIYQSAVRFIRYCLRQSKVCKKSTYKFDGLVRFRAKHFVALGDMLYRVLEKDVKIVYNQVHPPKIKQEDMWWTKKRDKVEEVEDEW